MVKDYSDNKRGNPLPLLYKILFYMRYSTVFVIPVVEHLLGREIAQ